MTLLLGVFTIITTLLAFTNCQSELPKGCFDAFYRAAMNTANTLRFNHSSPALNTMASLNASSLAYAQQLANATIFAGSGISGIGENILRRAMSSAVQVTACSGSNWFYLFILFYW